MEQPQESKGPNSAEVGRVAAEHLPPILYALEVCASAMEEAGRTEEASYFRNLAGSLSEAASRSD